MEQCLQPRSTSYDPGNLEQATQFLRAQVFHMYGDGVGASLVAHWVKPMIFLLLLFPSTLSCKQPFHVMLLVLPLLHFSSEHLSLTGSKKQTCLPAHCFFYQHINAYGARDFIFFINIFAIVKTKPSGPWGRAPATPEPMEPCHKAK